MAVYSCGQCGCLISLSVIPGGNPAAKADGWAAAWRQCRDCKGLWCLDCTKEEGQCPDCAGDLWVPDAEGKVALMFPALERVDPAADADSRTWREDFRHAINRGLPVFDGVTYIEPGLPDLREDSTAQRYLRWLIVLSWVTKADRAIDARVTVELDSRGEDISVTMGSCGVVWGGKDPYGPRAMHMRGRWADPSDADLIALALRVAWETYGVEMKDYVAKELGRLAELESGK